MLHEALVDMAIPLTRANTNRLAAMRDSGERITSIFTPFLRGPLRFMYALVNQIMFVTPAFNRDQALIQTRPGGSAHAQIIAWR